jgi:hypothetical protein
LLGEETKMNAASNTNSNPYAIAYGSKYESGLDVAEIAKRIRSEIKAGVKAGELPNAKYSVTISRYSGGQSLNVSIDNVPFAIANEARVRRDVLEPYAYHSENLPLHSDEAAALLKRVEVIVGAYNFDGSDSQSDYFHVNFYGDVKFAWSGQEKRETDALRAKYLAERGAAAAPAVKCDELVAVDVFGQPAGAEPVFPEGSL